MSKLPELLKSIDVSVGIDKHDIIDAIKKCITQSGYSIAEENGEKPWGGYIRFDSDNADNFIADFFPGLSPTDARMNIEGAEISPKILLVQPDQRLSWQFHNRRAERWMFLTDGSYNKSMTDEQGRLFEAPGGTEVQFAKQERHRLVGSADNYTIVAEIWQHTDSSELSNEDDIVRLQDDYHR